MSDDLKIKHVYLERMHGHQTSELELFPGLNIIYGKNGTGKTTLLHTIVNLLEMDLERFLYITFNRITVTTYSGDTVSLVQDISEVGDPRVTVFVNDKEVGICKSEQPCPASIIEVLKKIFWKRPVYLPAYRSMLEGATRRSSSYSRRVGPDFSEKEYNQIVERESDLLAERRRNGPHYSRIIEREQVELIAFKTLTCRAWFGNFVPIVRYPSIAEVHDELESEIERARYVVAAQDEENISTVFRRVLEVILSEKETEIDQDVGALIDRVRRAVTDLGPGSGDVPAVYGEIAEFLRSDHQYSDITSSVKIKGILKVYDDALSTRAEIKEKTYSGIDTFMRSVNKFLGESKSLVYEYREIPRRLKRGKLFVRLPDRKEIGLNRLSSGERHVLTLLFSATHMSPTDGLVTIDEPELSLHVDWQRIILGEIGKQAKDRQIIACTHSPEVAAEHLDAYIELTNIPATQIQVPEGFEQTELDIEE